MPCFHPVPAFQSGPGDRVRLLPPLGTATLSLPCGDCIGCRSSRALQWAHRCTHEASLWENNCFLTLTYDDAHVPNPPHLDPRALQLFLKRLRRAVLPGRPDAGVVSRDLSQGIRYFACGEYGERGGRPHFHLLLFNLRFTDTYQVGKAIYRSECVSRLWPDGGHALGECTAASAHYVAQYSLKKAGARFVPDADGVAIPGPFLRMSLRPAIGARWLFRYLDDLKFGYLVADGHRISIPRYYRSQLKSFFPVYSESLSGPFSQFGATFKSDSDPARLAAAEAIFLARKRLTEARTL